MFGWYGENCELELDECSAAPCQNGATCRDLVGEFSCLCLSGWVGNTCQTRVLECFSDPCQNGATCIDLVGGYECQCMLGFTGTLCEIELLTCAQDPCANDATCEDTPNGIRCSCSSAYTGVFCQIGIAFLLRFSIDVHVLAVLRSFIAYGHHTYSQIICATECNFLKRENSLFYWRKVLQISPFHLRIWMDIWISQHAISSFWVISHHSPIPNILIP